MKKTYMSIILRIMLLSCLAACSPQQNMNNTVNNNDSISNDSLKIVSDSAQSKQNEFSFSATLKFNEFVFGELPAGNIEDYSVYHNYPIEIKNNKVTFNGKQSEVISVEEEIKDSVLNQFRNEPRQQDVFDYFNVTLKSENILSVEFDYNLIPFWAVYMDENKCICYMNGIISTGDVTGFVQSY